MYLVPRDTNLSEVLGRLLQGYIIIEGGGGGRVEGGTPYH